MTHRVPAHQALVVAVLMAVLALGAEAAHAAPTASASGLPPAGSLIGLVYQSPGISPPGANDWSCKPPSAHPEPVVLVHGTFLDQTENWDEMALVLEHAGYCVFALDYGHRATQRIQHSARELRAFVQRVLKATGARRVSLVGHSQGGMMPRYYLKFLGGTRYVDDLVGLSPSNHGTTLFAAGPVGKYADCPACSQQVAGSTFLRHLNAGDQTPGPVSYTVIETSHDEVVTPYKSAFLPLDHGRVTNVLLQDRCPADPAEHVTIPYDPVAIQWVLNALGRTGPADPAFRPDCTGLALAAG
ncbi:MAG TPA: alpha/beta fold hydrolase [Solirubrobacteraceae bacterium]|jgi:triacylglycerol lipase